MIIIYHCSLILCIHHISIRWLKTYRSLKQEDYFFMQSMIVWAHFLELIKLTDFHKLLDEIMVDVIKQSRIILSPPPKKKRKQVHSVQNSENNRDKIKTPEEVTVWPNNRIIIAAFSGSVNMHYFLHPSVICWTKARKQKCVLGCKVVNGQHRKPKAYWDPDRTLPLKPDQTDHRPLKHTGSYITRPQMSVFLDPTTFSTSGLTETWCWLPSLWDL